jgi:hypothetical protein
MTFHCPNTQSALHILTQKDDFDKRCQNETWWQTQSYAGWLADGVKNMA